ncbi:flagellar basal body P-ring formation protein FlgA [Gilliamella sp. B2776]|uniref:flagellar basal body P-ring formation chaperone FlgA n=1 Tax=unclassified Gilliamella TaxID=2685620 RepID=UPI00226A1D3E|nr:MULTISPECIES: flagellar basal body P-ring formation chaperone FlgA [unclassified Gilliamella]MCX8650898.1 flagellar basal body P-ring formation protein FlgA [Gilliamella sp. B2779]MCX8654119.1 flagellar basal body P-ring formation protein FlgA [Gilliamella sp. B2737]MCX8657231.1 flagellar basal body P-ring formation protein FlgA [Gilliamella sp. B2894]MCX8665846.1 flagellar basal body P-ring formation protein FlgA [Gilliamella sp. B2887]MCX8692686.1 flagellar basal body P-ring formation pro
MKLIIGMFILFSCHIVLANSLSKQINDLITQQFSHNPEAVTISYTNDMPKLNCDNPTLSLLNTKKPWGNMTISVQCDNKKRFMHIYVAVSGHYLIAKQPIMAGSVITEDLIDLKFGWLDKLPSSVILNKSDALNHIATRNINQSETIKKAMLQKNWQVKAGQIVKVIIDGESYQITTNGKSLNNATLDEKISVKLNSGNVIDGVLTNQGVIIFNK